MQKKLFFKVVAVVALLGFISLSAPGLSSLEKKSSKIDFKLLLKKSGLWISSVLNMFRPISDPGNSGTSKTITPDKPSTKIKPLGDSLAGRPSDGD